MMSAAVPKARFRRDNDPRVLALWPVRVQY
jgi:hypothetical protein